MAGRKQTTGADHHPAPAGCAVHERADWLPADLPASLQPLRDRHVELAHEWAAAIDRIAGTREEHTDAEVTYRKAVRDAVAVGEPPPQRSPDLDSAILTAKIAIAVEDADAARDALSEHVLECLSVLRERRAELDMRCCSPSLLQALTVGSSNARAIATERVRRQLAELEADGPAIEVFAEDDAGATPELAATHA